MIKNVYWRTNLYFLVITDDANRSWCMEIHVDQINCSQDQIVMQSSIQCRTFEFLKAVKKTRAHCNFLESLATPNTHCCVILSVPFIKLIFFTKRLVFFYTCFKRSKDLETDSCHVVRYFCRPIEMCFPRSLIRQSNRITTKWCLMHWDPELPR